MTISYGINRYKMQRSVSNNARPLDFNTFYHNVSISYIHAVLQRGEIENRLLLLYNKRDKETSEIRLHCSNLKKDFPNIPSYMLFDIILNMQPDYYVAITAFYCGAAGEIVEIMGRTKNNIAEKLKCYEVIRDRGPTELDPNSKVVNLKEIMMATADVTLLWDIMVPWGKEEGLQV
jgi:hypothetical protein